MNVDPLRAGDPARLGDYWLAGRLGSGGQGVVYEAYDEAANRVAVKVLHAYLAGDSQLRRRFLREVRAAQRVASFCTATVLAHDLEGERPFIVSEFVPGPSMRQAITSPLAGDTLHRLAVGMATALSAIHQAEVVHRDLKPENVLLGPDGPRVIDFGIARAAGLSMTSTGELTGTPLYMAPELFAGGRAEPASDVFAWGAMVYFAATGRDAFAAPTTVAVINRLLTLQVDLPPMPAGLRELVGRALSKDPELRPTAQELLLSLLGGTSLAEGARAAAAVRPPAELAGEPALGTVAEQVYAALPPGGREVARQVLLRMVDVRDGEEVPRQATLAELPDPAAAEPVLAALERAALIQRGAETLAVRKAALLRAWPRLHEWVSGDREALTRHRRLGEAARLWAAAGRRHEDLLRGTALQEALRWTPSLPEHLTLNLTEKDFLEAGKLQSVRQRRRRRLLVTSLAVLLVASLTAGAFAWQQSVKSDESGRQLAAERARAGARRVALQAEALRKSDPVMAMQLSLAAYRLADVPESRSALFDSLGQQEQRVFTDPALANTGRALSVDGSLLVSAGGDRVTVYDVATGRAKRTFTGVGQGPLTAALGPDNDTLALGSEGKIRLWSLRTGEKLGEGWFGPAHLKVDHAPSDLRFSQSGGYLAVRANMGGPYNGLWNVRTRSLEGSDYMGPPAVGPGDRFGAIYVRERQTLVSLPDGKPITDRKLPAGLHIGGFTPDGAFAMNIKDYRLEMWNLATGKRDRREFPEGHPEIVFSADGALMVAVVANRVTIYRLRDCAMLVRFTSAAPLAEDPRLSADNRYLTLLDETGQVTTYDIGGHTRPGPALPAESTSRQFSADGGRVFALAKGGEHTWTLPGLREGGRPVSVPVGRYAEILSAVSPDGTILATTNLSHPQGPFTLWNVATGRKLGTVKVPQKDGVGDNKMDLVFSPDGRTLAASFAYSSDYYSIGTVLVAEVAHPDKTKLFTRISGGRLHFSADSKTLTTGDQGGVDVIDLGAGKVLPRAQGPGTTAKSWLTLDPSGRRAASPYGNRAVALWESGTWKPTGGVFRVAGDVVDAWFSPDGETVAVAHDYRVTLFEASSGRRLGSPRALSATMHSSDDGRPVLAFVPGGAMVRAIAVDGTYREIVLDPGKVAPQVCRRAGRGLSEAEWREHVGQDFAFVKSC